MLTGDDIKNILHLKERDYSKRKAAKELGFNPKTIQKYWGNDHRSREEDLYFKWGECRNCGTYFPKPKFLKKFECPNCGAVFTWKVNWYQLKKPI